MKHTGLSLALSDLRFDRNMALTLILAIAAVLTPLLILLGLKTGVIETARSQLLQDPRNLEVVIYQNTQLSEAWFEQMASLPSTRFVIPRTRTINATINLVNQNRNILQGVEMVPTKPGDPLFPASVSIPQSLDEIVISQQVADDLKLVAGDQLMGVINRRLSGEDQRVEITLTVVSILPEAAWNREAIFVTLPLLTATEDYRDGYQVPELSVTEGEQKGNQARDYANARIYADQLDDVLLLAERLRSEGLEVRTRAAEIKTVQRMDQLLDFLFAVIALIGCLGGAIALGANIWTNVDRKRRDLALLRLMGLGDGEILMIPIWHGLSIAFGAFLLALCGYGLAAVIFNRQLASSLPEQSYACQLHANDVGIMLLTTLIVAVLASLLAGRRATRVDPAECLREVG